MPLRTIRTRSFIFLIRNIRLRAIHLPPQRVKKTPVFFSQNTFPLIQYSIEMLTIFTCL